MLPSLIVHIVGYETVVGAHNTVYVRCMLQAPSCSSGMANIGAHNTVRQISVPTTLLGKCRRPQYYLASDTLGRLHSAYLAWPSGIVLKVRKACQGTILGIWLT